MELVAKLTEESLENLKHDVTTRFFAAHIPVDRITFEPDTNNKTCVTIHALLRIMQVNLLSLVSLQEDFCSDDIDIGHVVEGREMAMGLVLRGVSHGNLNIETKFEF